MNPNNALALSNVTFRFSKNAVPFFSNLSVSFPAGKIHFIRGRNGVGKSVFFRILQGAFSQGEIATGDYILDDKKFVLDSNLQLPAEYTKSLNMVCQKFDTLLADQFSFDQNLRFANLPPVPTLAGLPEHKPLPDFLSRFAIDPATPVRLLSGGQRQILAMIMMLQKPTKILLLDEPTAALDDHNAALVMEFVRDLVQTSGLTVLIICHDKELVEQYAREGYYQISADPVSGVRNIDVVKTV